MNVSTLEPKRLKVCHSIAIKSLNGLIFLSLKFCIIFFCGFANTIFMIINFFIENFPLLIDSNSFSEKSRFDFVVHLVDFWVDCAGSVAGQVFLCAFEYSAAREVSLGRRWISRMARSQSFVGILHFVGDQENISTLDISRTLRIQVSSNRADTSSN